LVSCNSSRNDNKASAEITDHNETAFTLGTWHITDFVKNGINEEDKYAPYVFEFESNHSITAKSGNHVYKGRWEIVSDGITDDAPAADLDFIIEFKEQDTISRLNGEWMIEEKTAVRVDLSNISEELQETNVSTMVKAKRADLKFCMGIHLRYGD
jgi:hypothetical protein